MAQIFENLATETGFYIVRHDEGHASLISEQRVPGDFRWNIYLQAIETLLLAMAGNGIDLDQEAIQRSVLATLHAGDATLKASEILTCKKCDGSDIDEKVWLNQQTGNIDLTLDERTLYCNTCEQFINGQDEEE